MKLASFAIGILAFLLTANTAQAELMGISFYNITNNGNENIANQLGAEVRDRSEAFDYFGEAIASDEVLFTFTNNVDSGINSNIGEIYFDDGTILSQTRIIDSLGGFTKYTGGTIKPGNLPSGNIISPAFVATAGFGADTTKNPKNGVNATIDILGIVIKLQTGLDFGDVQTALTDGPLRLGLHVRSIGAGAADFSDSFVSNPFGDGPAAIATPIPAAMWLFGPALLALTGVIRRKPQKLS